MSRGKIEKERRHQEQELEVRPRGVNVACLCRCVGQTELEEGGPSGGTGPRRPGSLDCRKHTEGGTSPLPHPVQSEGGEGKEREDKKRERYKRLGISKNLSQGREGKTQLDRQTWKETKRTKESRKSKEKGGKKRWRERTGKPEKGNHQRSSLSKKVASLVLKVMIVEELMSS